MLLIWEAFLSEASDASREEEQCVRLAEFSAKLNSIFKAREQAKKAILFGRTHT